MTDYYLPDPPLFPERNWYHTGETGDRAQKALLAWVKGGRFHPYGTLRRDAEDYEYGEYKTLPGTLEYEGHYQDWSGHITWGVRYRRVGEPENHGSSYGYSCAEDAAYAACTLIEQHEREQYQQRLVVGVA